MMVTPACSISSDGVEQLASLGLLDAEHMDAFRRALNNMLLTEVTENTFAEIIDGLPTRDSWLDFNPWRPGHPVEELKHDKLCPGSLEKARELRSDFDIYVLSFPSWVLRDFQNTSPNTKEYLLSLVELLARACHQIATFLFQLDQGVHKHELFAAWYDSPGDHLPSWHRLRPPCAFTHWSYINHEQYPHGLADVAGYWAEAKIFGGVIVFDRGPSGTERREMYLHNGSLKGPSTLFPPTAKQFESLAQFLLASDTVQTQDCGSFPVPIKASLHNGWRYHADDAITRFNIFRDRYERKEPPSRCDSRINGWNWPEVAYEINLLNLRAARAQGQPVEDAGIAEAEEGTKRITPSSPNWWPRRAGMPDL